MKNLLIVEIFGEENINNIKNDSSSEDWSNFENEIEKLKKVFSEFEPGDLKLNCRIFDDNSNKTLEDYIIEYNKKTLKYKYEIKKVIIIEIDGNY